MALLEIKTFGNEVLRRRALPVKSVTPELRKLAEDMLETMYQAPGIGLAAPQVGHSLRIIVVDVSRDDEERKPYVFFNPEVEPEEGDNPAEPYEEGCLSVPDIFAEVVRPSRIRLKALDLEGNPVEMRNLDGMLARCIQHEVDHLEGVLFVDRISPAERAMNQTRLKKMARSQKG